jgi:hypothetical protein
MAEQQRWFTTHQDYDNYGLALASDTEAYVGNQGKAFELNEEAVAEVL